MTELAQQLIEREKRERTGYLDLGNCGLTELPDLSELEWLETLIVSNWWWDWEKQKEEFDWAWVTFQKTGKPRILTFFKKDGVDPLTVQDSLRKFHSKLTTEHSHFPDNYQGYAELEGKIWKEIEQIINA